MPKALKTGNLSGNNFKPPKHYANMHGQVFGRLTVIRPLFVKSECVYWECLCSCGKSKAVSGSSLRRKDRPTVSCGCAQKEFQRSRKGKPGKRSSYGQYSLKRIRHAISASAKEREISFNVPDNYLMDAVFRNCFYCNAAPSNRIKSNRVGEKDICYNGLDRIDSTLGYTIDNVVTACRTCNIAKACMSQREFYEWISAAFNNLTKTGAYNRQAVCELDFNSIWD